MQWLRDIISVLGFLLTAYGTYVTYRSDLGVEVMRDELLRYSTLITFVCCVGVYHYYNKFHIVRSVLNGREKLDDVYGLIYELDENPQTIRRLKQGNDKLSDVCQLMSAAMRKYHSPSLTVNILYLNRREDRPYVNLLCRNKESLTRSKGRPKGYSDLDYVTDNTDFQSLIWKSQYNPIDKVYYLNNFLPLSITYNNTHFPQEWKQKYDSLLVGWYYRITHWCLPYRSSLVVPIVTSLGNQEYRIEGFLAVDSPQLNSFSKNYDLPLVRNVANALAPIIANYAQMHLKHKDEMQ